MTGTDVMIYRHLIAAPNCDIVSHIQEYHHFGQQFTGQTTSRRCQKKIVRIVLAVLLFIIICAAVDLAYMLLRVETSSPQWRLSDWFPEKLSKPRL